MLTVTEDFKNALMSPIKGGIEGYIVLQDGTELLPGGDLQSYTIESVGGFLRTAMSRITVSIKGEHNLKGQSADVYYGVMINGAFEYTLKGKFEFTDAVYKKDKDSTEITGFDNMMRFHATNYTTVGNFPTTLLGFLQALTSLAGVVLENTEIYNGTLSIDEDYYQTMSEYTARDVLEDICEASASYAIINSEGRLELRQVAHTGETLTYQQLLPPYTVGDMWGGVNSLVLSRQPQEDNVYTSNEDDINSPTNRNVLNLDAFNVGYFTEDQ